MEDRQFGAWSVPEGQLGRAMRSALLGIVDVWWRELSAAVEVLGAQDHSSSAMIIGRLVPVDLCIGGDLREILLWERRGEDS